MMRAEPAWLLEESNGFGDCGTLVPVSVLGLTTIQSDEQI